MGYWPPKSCGVSLCIVTYMQHNVNIMHGFNGLKTNLIVMSYYTYIN